MRAYGSSSEGASRRYIDRGYVACCWESETGLDDDEEEEEVEVKEERGRKGMEIRRSHCSIP